jgi:hypothetical protein
MLLLDIEKNNWSLSTISGGNELDIIQAVK